MKRFKRQLSIAYVALIVGFVAAMVRVEFIARQASVEACDAFHQSQEVLKDVLIVAIPDEPSVDPSSEEKVDYDRRVEFRDTLIAEIEEAECK